MDQTATKKGNKRSAASFDSLVEMQEHVKNAKIASPTQDENASAEVPPANCREFMHMYFPETEEEMNDLILNNPYCGVTTVCAYMSLDSFFNGAVAVPMTMKYDMSTDGFDRNRYDAIITVCSANPADALIPKCLCQNEHGSEFFALPPIKPLYLPVSYYRNAHVSLFKQLCTNGDNVRKSIYRHFDQLLHCPYHKQH